MNLEELMERIDFPEEAKKSVRDTEISEKEYIKLNKTYSDDKDGFISLMESMDNGYEKALLFCLEKACRTYDEYRKRDISDKVYDETMYDITIWMNVCKKRYGFYGLKELKWISNSIDMKLFRLGRLQFEPCRTDEKLGVIEKGTEVLNVHIPEGEPLDFSKCMESFKSARDFFRNRYEYYICESWLLSKDLVNLLDKESNIVKFQSFFKVVDEHFRFPQAEERIFGYILEEKENYSEYTTLQKKAKEYILNGGKISIGIGYGRFDDDRFGRK